jgi:transposase-like protein
LVRSGLVVAEAADEVGVSKTVAWRWFRHVGGVMPEPFRAGRPIVSAGRLSFQEREEISCRRAAGEGVRAIARALGRSPSTISRELRRGTVRRKSGYRASVAQALADQRARRPRARMLALDDRLREHVQNRLDAKDSPEQISRRLELLFPDDPAMRVSHETIYRSLYVQGRGGLRRELVKCLRTGRALCAEPLRSVQLLCGLNRSASMVGQEGPIMSKRRRHTPDQIIRKLAEGQKLLAGGMSVEDVCRQFQIAESAWARWLNQYGGMKADDAKRLRELEGENARLKKLLAEAELDKAMLKEIAEGNF